jgi:homoserine O-acetyltransferase
MADPDWHGGRYLEAGIEPRKGLAVARMAAHITYLSEEALHRKFGRNLQDRETVAFGFDADFQVESYLRHQGTAFVERFDANSYLYITRAMDYFDLMADHGGVLANAFTGTATRFCVISFTSDCCIPPRTGHRARAERRGGNVISRNRIRQGARRLSAGGAGTVRHYRRLPEFGG